MRRKKIMKKFPYLILVGVLMFFGGCFYQGDNSSSWQNEYWFFPQNTNEVKEIKIVEVGYPKDYYVVGMWTPEDCVVKEIDVAYAEELYKDIENIDMEHDPYAPAPTGKGFLISYSDGDKVLFMATSPSTFIDRGFIEHIEVDRIYVKCCNQEEFDALIDKYLNLP